MKSLPEDWAPMEEGLILKEVKLQPTDAEYQQVVAELMKTAAGSPTIIEVHSKALNTIPLYIFSTL